MKKEINEKFSSHTIVVMLSDVIHGIYPNLSVTFRDYRSTASELDDDNRWVGIFVWADKFKQTECLGMYFLGKEDCLNRRYTDIIIVVVSWVNNLIFKRIEDFFA